MRTKKKKKKLGQPRGNWGGASLALFPVPLLEIPLSPVKSCRALTRLTKEGLFAVCNSELKQESAVVPDVMNSNRKFDVSLINGNLDPSHTVNLNAFVSTPAVRGCRIRALKERQYQLPVAILMSVTSTFTLLKVPNDIDES